MTRHNDRKAPVQVTCGRADELSPIDSDAAASRLIESASGKGRLARPRKTKLAVLGIPSGVLDAGDPAYARCVRLASAYRKVRCRELGVSHGYVSSGVSALLASASMALAASRYLYEQAASGGPNMEQLRTAAKLADSARQNELAAWEVCARESVARKKLATLTNGMPWIIDNEEKRKPGPKKREETLPELPPVGSPLEGWVQSASIE